jgi:hypothetical protein
MSNKDFNMRAYIDIINESNELEVIDLSEPEVIAYDDIGMEEPIEDFEALAAYGAEEDLEALAGPEEDFEALAAYGASEDFEALAGYGEFANNQNGYHKREGQNFWTIDNDDPYWDTHEMEGSSAFEEAPRHTDKEETPKFDMNFWTSLFK